MELLYTILGPGCESVSMLSDKDADVVVGHWKDGKLGTVRLARPYGPFGATVFAGKDKVIQSDPKMAHVDYKPMLERVWSSSEPANRLYRNQRRSKFSRSWMRRNAASKAAARPPSFDKTVGDSPGYSRP